MCRQTISKRIKLTRSNALPNTINATIKREINLDDVFYDIKLRHAPRRTAGIMAGIKIATESIIP